ncbi:hypothetical protein T310_1952 [Rasamsonia emersonii CBS 393.64]|uniref:Uncharacterized protein n=1 Tax=Rasamsonia emersonii (strain ATCC 16479 / CBS 393.64 / IMI 116815) TaxID=1408163 RepID=A0A0F4Z1Q6_RASE3|nr:hypothetical protein T310_1952 [Rasamsonia emersonii CBS 393.64]KKA24031.1 hypothetical protein T310_1952 [Rasamsonia emersonii CBS 393.64]
MFENGIFGFFKSSNKEESAPQQTWNPNTMTMEQPTNYAGNNKQEVVTEQPSSQEPMKLRGGGEAGELRRSDVLRVLRGLLLLDELHPSSSLSIVKAIPAISGAKFAID